MNILKRPMFFSATICSAVAALALYYNFIVVITFVCAVFALIVRIFLKNYKYVNPVVAVLLFATSLFFQFSKINLLFHIYV